MNFSESLTFVRQRIKKLPESPFLHTYICTYLSKAFDLVNHGLLLQILSGFGLCNYIVPFFKSFLCNRYQFVTYNGYHSPLYSVSSGVTQGFNLGHILFNIFFMM
jgi:hypothetical protein